MTDTPRPGRAGGRRPARTSGPSLSCRSPRIRACRSSGRSSRRRPAGRGPVRSGARCRSSRRASPMSPSSRWHRTSRSSWSPGFAPGTGGSPSPLTQHDVRAAGRQPVLDDDRLHVRMLPAEVPGEPPQGVPLAVVPPPAVLVPDRLRRRRERPGVVGTDGRRAQCLTAGGPRPVAVVLDASGACRRPCARNGGRSRPPRSGDARRTPSGPRAPCRAAGRRGRPRTAAAEAAGAGPVAPLAHPRVRRRLPHAERRAQAPRLDRILAAPHLPAGLQKRRDPGREGREPRRQMP